MEPPKFGDSLIIDDEDDQYLESLPEIERESLLAQRFDELQRYRERLRLERKYRTEPEEDDESESDVSDISVGSPRKAAEEVQKPVLDDAEVKRSLVPSRESLLPLFLTRSMLHAHYLILPRTYRDSVLVGAVLGLKSRDGHGGREFGVVERVEGPSNQTASISVRLSSSNNSSVVTLQDVEDSAFSVVDVERFMERASIDLIQFVIGRKLSKKVKALEKAKEFTWDSRLVDASSSHGVKGVPGSVDSGVRVRQISRPQATSLESTFSASTHKLADESFVNPFDILRENFATLLHAASRSRVATTSD